MKNRTSPKLEFTVVSLNSVQRGGWTFKVSANDYEEGILIIAFHNKFGYSTIRYFQNPNDGRKWIDNLVYLDRDTVAAELKKLKSAELNKK
jgi:hypothetical protein